MRALDDSDPRLIGQFMVLGLLGAGGMGRVYLARPADGPDEPDALVAVKVIRPELAEDGPFRERFRREVAAAARVNALFTAEVVDADPDAPAPWLATCYLPGKTLAEEVADHGPLVAHRLRGLALRLAEVLAAVHATGVVHRDLKPSNVLLTADGPRLICPAGDAPSDVAASPDGAWVYVADNGSGTVTVIDAATATVAATVPVGVSPVSLAVAPDSSRVYVVDATADTIILMQRP
jgi:YVTN family beta-propeller protein